MRLIDKSMNRIPRARDPKYDVKEHVLEFSSLVLNSQHSPMIACMPLLVLTEKCQSEFLLSKFSCLLLLLLLWWWFFRYIHFGILFIYLISHMLQKGEKYKL